MTEYKKGFILGVLCMIFLVIAISCSLSPLHADYDTPGHSAAFPLYVKIID